MTLLLMASLACAAWIYLLLLRGGFWLAGERDTTGGAAPVTLPSWPHVVAIVPARDEASIITTTLHSLLQQNYPGRFNVVVVDDHSNDGTGAVARAASANEADRLVVLRAPNLAARVDG